MQHGACSLKQMKLQDEHVACQTPCFSQFMFLKNRIFNHDSFHLVIMVCFSSRSAKTVKVMVSIKLAYGSGIASTSLPRKVML